MRRNTIQRSLTLEAVRNLNCHPTADEVYTEVIKQYPAISKGTVYRNLNQLIESGDICTVKVPGGADHFDHHCQKHYHARCLKCGRVFDVDMDYIVDLEKVVKDSHGFEISGYDLMFKGVCAECKEKGRH